MNHKNQIINALRILLLILFVSLNCWGKSNKGKVFCIYIDSQKSFDTINERLKECIEHGNTNIQIIFKRGVYIYREKHLFLSGISDKKISIELCGNKSELIAFNNPVGIESFYDGVFSYKDSFFYENGELVNIWNDLTFSKQNVEIVDYDNGICRLKTNGYKEMHETETNHSYIQITEWYLSKVYKIIKIEDDYIYFKVKRLEYTDWLKNYNVNYDFGYGNITPRFRTCNTYDNLFNINNNEILVPSNSKRIKETNVCNFASIIDCQLSTISIKDLIFRFNSNISGSSLIKIERTACKHIDISNCKFHNIKSRIVDVLSTSNVYFHNNDIMENGRDGFVSDHYCSNIWAYDNHFERNGLDLMNSFCIWCEGTYHISNNYFLNFGYGAIRVGVWYGTKKVSSSSGVVEYNEMSYTSDYIKSAWKHTLMDSGAIYISTQNDSTDIRYNYIHGYTGMCDNRGIFCDDGASGFKIYGNIIVNTPNKHCIDSRLCSDIEDYDNIDKINCNNVIIGNIIDGSIRFESKKEIPQTCFKGRNFIIGNNYPNNLINNINVLSDDLFLSSYSTRKGKVFVSKKDFQELKKIDNWKNIKKHIRKRYKLF